MASFTLSVVAERDIVSILTWTHEHFGEQARLRYEALLVQAMIDVAENPFATAARPVMRLRDWLVLITSGTVAIESIRCTVEFTARVIFCFIASTTESKLRLAASCMRAWTCRTTCPPSIAGHPTPLMISARVNLPYRPDCFLLCVKSGTRCPGRT